jgi:hypothetical protein
MSCKYANVVTMANSLWDYTECYVMKEPVYKDGFTEIELDQDVPRYEFVCHDSRVSARHDPIQVEYVLEPLPAGST